MGESKSTFGNVLRRLRSAAALSQEELAERAGLSRSGISLLERGLHPAPRLETVRMLADGLKLDLEDRAALLAAARPALWRDHVTGTPTTLSRQVSLPTPLTRLIGRESQVVALRALLTDAAVRLVTVTGPGGVGKTRLALDVAAGLVDVYRDGVVFVDLAPFVDPDLAIQTIAATLGVQENGGQHLNDTLCQVLSDKRLLILLDNCERVLAVAPMLTTLLSACQNVTIFTTSRQPLRVRGEHEFPLPPLPLPVLDQRDGFTAWTANPAVALFAERASEVQPDFALTMENAATIVAICHHLDGLPLPIELAAARVRVLPPTALGARLERRLPLLTGGGLDLPPRQRTIRATIGWSYDLLAADDQALFRRCAFFNGGFTLEAAEALIGPEWPTMVLEGISRLVEQSLLRRVSGPDDESRYVMLETLREYGIEKLEESEEAAATSQAHAAYFVEFAERGQIYHLAPNDSVDRRYRRIEADHANVVQALRTMAEAGDARGVARLAGALALFWQIRAYHREGRYWLEWALSRGAALSPGERCRTLSGLSSIQWGQGQPEAAAASARESLRLAEQIGSEQLVAYSVHVLGLAAASQEQWPEAEVMLTRALKLWRGLVVRAEEAIALQLLSGAAYGMGDHQLSAERAEAALALSRELNHAFGAAQALGRLARLARDAGDVQREATAYHQALDLYVKVGNRWAICDPIAGLSGIAAIQGHPDVAARLVGGVDTIIQEAGAFGTGVATIENRDRALSRVSVLLGEQRSAELRAAGQAMRLEDVVELAASIEVPSESSLTAATSAANIPTRIASQVTRRDVGA